jgi:putative ABC transport system permease protein
MQHILQDLRYAFRQFVRRPGIFVLCVLTLGLGIGANSAIFSFVNALLLRPLPFPEADRLVAVRSLRGGEAGKLMPREWEELERDKSLFDEIATYYPSQYNVTSAGPPEAVPAMMISGNLFRVLGVRTLHGDTWPLDFYRSDNPVVVLSHGFWQRRFGSDPKVIGTSIILDAAPYRVMGVMPPGFHFPIRSEVYRPSHLYRERNRTTRSQWAVARLRSGISVAEAQSRLDVFAARMAAQFPETNRGVSFRAVPLRDIFVGDVRPFLWLLFAMVGVVLLIACANVVNLLLAKAVGRRKEIAVRAAMGAGRGRLIQQLLTESLLLSGLGGLAGLGLAFWWIRALKALVRIDLPSWMEITPDSRVLAFTLLAAVAAGLLAGLAPALTASNATLAETFQDAVRGGSSGRGQRRLRELLVAGQIALAVALLSTAGLLVRSLWQLQSAETGFTRESLLTVRTDPPSRNYNRVEQTSRFYKLAIERLAALPGVEAAAADHSLPLAGNDNLGKPMIAADGQSSDDIARNPFVNLHIVSQNYLDVMGVPLLRGRSFTDDDRYTTRFVAVIGHSLAARLFGSGDPLLRRIRLAGMPTNPLTNQDTWFTIVGVAADIHSERLGGVPGMDLYLSNQQQFAGDTYFVLRTRSSASGLSAAIARAVQQVDPEQSVFDIQPMDARIANTIWQRRLAGMLSVVFGGLAFALGSIGVYSVVAYAVGQRSREMGIRLALGETPGGLKRMVVAQGLRPALAGLCAGVLAAAVAGWAVRGMLYEVGSFDPITLAGVPALLLVSALIACYVPARRAAQVDPAITLREG